MVSSYPCIGRAYRIPHQKAREMMSVTFFLCELSEKEFTQSSQRHKGHKGKKKAKNISSPFFGDKKTAPKGGIFGVRHRYCFIYSRGTGFVLAVALSPSPLLILNGGAEVLIKTLKVVLSLDIVE
jgi:hypothetical protein